ncbi:MAG TPA: hypothetical protein VFA93_00705 [Patescibacteria group bacterium]|nr:hypothetical protein [Patescibacteria group bacterium]
MPNVSQTLLASLNGAVLGISLFVPKFFAGLVILLIGIIISSILKRVLVEIFRTLKVETFLKKYGVPEMREEFTWTNVLSEIVRWFVIVVFLIPTADVWGLPRITSVLNEFLLYLPNVFVAAVIALVGFVFARLTHDVILVSAKGVDAETAATIASVARWAINVFVVLAVLSQLGVATDLIRILFTGFVAMLAVAGGIAFGLGGQSAAKDVVEGLRRKLK